MADAKKAVRAKKGEPNTMNEADWVNENVLVPLQALSNLTVSPAGSGKLVIKGEKAVLQLDGLAGTIPDMIIVLNGTPFRCTLKGKVGEEIT